MQASNALTYTVTCTNSPDIRFHVMSDNESVARQQALDKIGYVVIARGNRFMLTDVDEPGGPDTIELEATSYGQAYVVAFQQIGWTFSEPTVLIGGQLGSGFGEFTNEEGQ